MAIERITNDEARRFDELVAKGAIVHVERMSNQHIWMAVESEGRRVVLNFHSHRGISVNLEEEPACYDKDGNPLASPETLPSRAGEVPLPNDKWARADKQPDWALCLDPENRFYGWKMYECNGNWVSGAKMTAEEVEKAMGLGSLQPYRPLLEALRATQNRGLSSI